MPKPDILQLEVIFHHILRESSLTNLTMSFSKHDLQAVTHGRSMTMLAIATEALLNE